MLNIHAAELQLKLWYGYNIYCTVFFFCSKIIIKNYYKKSVMWLYFCLGASFIFEENMALQKSNIKQSRVFSNFTGPYWPAGVFASLWPSSQHTMFCCSWHSHLCSLWASRLYECMNARLLVFSPPFTHLNPTVWRVIPSVSFLMWNHSFQLNQSDELRDTLGNTSAEIRDT